MNLKEWDSCICYTVQVCHPDNYPDCMKLVILASSLTSGALSTLLSIQNYLFHYSQQLYKLYSIILSAGKSPYLVANLIYQMIKRFKEYTISIAFVKYLFNTLRCFMVLWQIEDVSYFSLFWKKTLYSANLTNGKSLS